MDSPSSLVTARPLGLGLTLVPAGSSHGAAFRPAQAEPVQFAVLAGPLGLRPAVLIGEPVTALQGGKPTFAVAVLDASEIAAA